MRSSPCQKGTSVLPVVQALKQRGDARSLLPKEFWKYLDEPMLISGWYPERDYWVLVAALVKTLDPAQVGADPWRYFAKFSAQRDVGGQVTSEAHSAAAGVYRNFANMTDPQSFFSGAMRLWKQYHDTGRMEIIGAYPESNSLVMRLLGFVIPIEGFVRLQGYYLEEYGRLVGIGITSSVKHSTALKHPFCEWEHQLDRTPATEAYIASLPPMMSRSAGSP